MSSGMQNAQNFAPVVSSMVLEPSFFDPFFMFSQFWVFLRVWLRPGPRPGAAVGLPGGFLGLSGAPGGPKRGFLGFLGQGGPGGPVPGLSRVCPGLIPLYYRNPLVGGSGTRARHTESWSPRCVQEE